MKKDTTDIARALETKACKHTQTDRSRTVFDTEPYLGKYKKVYENQEEQVASQRWDVFHKPPFVDIASGKSTDEAFNVSFRNLTADKRHFGASILCLGRVDCCVAKGVRGSQSIMAGPASVKSQVLPYIKERVGIVFKEVGMGRIRL